MQYFRFLILTFFCSHLIGFTQTEKPKDDTDKVVAIIKKSQDLYGGLDAYRFETNYKSYGSHYDKEVLQEYDGLTIKKGQKMYLGISNTILLNSSNKTLKIYGNEKIIEVRKGNNQSVAEQNPVFLDNLLKNYKYKTLEETKDSYICILQTGYITQVPYGKIEMYISKKDYSITKQVMYMLAQLPYTSEDGTTKTGNPRIEINISNFRKKITENESKKLRLSSYIRINKSKISTTKAFQDFEIERIK